MSERDEAHGAPQCCKSVRTVCVCVWRGHCRQKCSRRSPQRTVARGSLPPLLPPPLHVSAAAWRTAASLSLYSDRRCGCGCRLLCCCCCCDAACCRLSVAGCALFVHHDPVVVLSTSVTAATRVFPVLANATLAVRHIAAHGPCLLPDLLDHGLKGERTRSGGQQPKKIARSRAERNRLLPAVGAGGEPAQGSRQIAAISLPSSGEWRRRAACFEAVRCCSYERGASPSRMRQPERQGAVSASKTWLTILRQPRRELRRRPPFPPFHLRGSVDADVRKRGSEATPPSGGDARGLCALVGRGALVTWRSGGNASLPC